MVREGGTLIQTLIQTTLIRNITFLIKLFIPCQRLEIEPNERIELVNNNFYFSSSYNYTYLQDEKSKEDIREAQCGQEDAQSGQEDAQIGQEDAQSGQEDAQRLLTPEIVRDVPFES